MSLDDNITRVHRPATYKPKTVYIAWNQDLWQQGDPMFYSIKDRSQVRVEPKQQLPSKPLAESLATAKENRTAVKVKVAPPSYF
jgi:hypothetical protein